MPLSKDIKALALEAGFHAVGITSAWPFDEAEAALCDRLDRGLLEGSGYSSSNIRLYTHPQENMLKARSIVSLALSYLTDDMDEPQIGGGPRGFMARFSRGRDYHLALQERLFALMGNIQRKLGTHAEIRSFADTGSMVDRAAAVRSGLGSRGKNTCVYVGKYKSWVVLGELLLDVESETDPPALLDICGECDKCMKACPTGAICAPYTVDVRICLSQVTQSKGFIPEWLREKMGARIYGCDTCQSACPLNKGASPGNIEVFRPSSGIGSNPELLPLLNMTSSQFKEWIAPTTASWIRRTRLRRNVAIALGNIGDPAAVPSLITALSDPDPIIRGHAAWALGKISTPDARLALAKALPTEIDYRVVEEIRHVLDAQ